MSTRQAMRSLALFVLLLGACTPPPSTLLPSATLPPPTATLDPTATFTPAPTATPTPLGCLSQPGRLEPGTLQTTKPPQDYIVYLPPCYDEQTSLRYPVLYLLHGQTYIDDQWVRLGAPQAADALIHSGEAPPFIMVFPDDRYWNVAAGPGFGQRLIEGLIPYIDAHYRTLADRSHRALGGLSRGGGWTVRLGFMHPELFGELGLHSPAVFEEDVPVVGKWIAAMPDDSFPRLWLDVGDHDRELSSTKLFESTLTRYAVVHEFHLYSGDHSESYWSQHVEEYLRWYAAGWTTADPS